MLLFSLSALGQTGGAVPETSGQLFRPSIDASSMLWTDDSGRAQNGAVLARAFAHYARNPVIYVGGDGAVDRVVGDVFQLSLLGAYTRGPVRIGVDVPVYLRSLGSEGGETGLGDIALDLKVSLLDRRDDPVGLALAGRVSVPTTTVDAALGNRGLGWEVTGIVDKQAGDLHLAANLGAKGVPRAELENFTWGNQLVARLGAGYAIDDRSGVSLDFGGQLNLNEIVPASSPVEGLLGGWYRVQQTVLRAGVGTALTSGFGAPDLRVVLGVGFEPREAKDTDGDGIVDKDDTCPADPEDADGFADTDGCPEPTAAQILVVDSAGAPLPNARFEVLGQGSGSAGGELMLEEGTYEVVVSLAGYRFDAGKATLRVPGGERVSETYVMSKEILPAQLTVRVVDTAGMDIPGGQWEVRGRPGSLAAAGSTIESQPGAYEIRAQAEGWRPSTVSVDLTDGEVETLKITLQPAKVELTKERIEIKDSVYFETAKAVIKPESFGLLDEVAQILNEHPELTKIRVEGHTDSRGAAGYNLQLSKDRAASVRDYLIGRGVAASRLESEGFGEGKPLVKGENEAAWSKNRRVDFFVVERQD